MKTSANFFISLLTIVIGVLFAVMQGGVISIAMTVLGVGLIIWAVMDLLEKDYVPCAIKAIIGAVVITCGWLIADVMLFVFAGLLLIYAVYQLYLLIKNNKRKAVKFIEPVLYLAIAVLLLFAKGEFLNTIFLIAGIALIVEGVFSILTSIKK